MTSFNGDIIINLDSDGEDDFPIMREVDDLIKELVDDEQKDIAAVVNLLSSDEDSDGVENSLQNDILEPVVSISHDHYLNSASLEEDYDFMDLTNNYSTDSESEDDVPLAEPSIKISPTVSRSSDQKSGLKNELENDAFLAKKSLLNVSKTLNKEAGSKNVLENNVSLEIPSKKKSSSISKFSNEQISSTKITKKVDRKAESRDDSTEKGNCIEPSESSSENDNSNSSDSGSKRRTTINVNYGDNSALSSSDESEDESSDEDYGRSRNKRQKSRKGRNHRKKKGNCHENRCEICEQYLESVVILTNWLPDYCSSESELMAIENLYLLNDERDIKPECKITNFAIYDIERHLYQLDDGLIEKGKQFFFRGYVKSIWDEDDGIENGHPGEELGPIIAWWPAGYDGGDRIDIGISTNDAEYHLMAPCEEYKGYMTEIYHKTYMVKYLIEYLEINRDASEEDVLDNLSDRIPPGSKYSYTMDSLSKQAQFIVDQVKSYDEANDDEDISPLMETEFMKSFAENAGVEAGSERTVNHNRRNVSRFKAGTPKATTTELVQGVFEMFFTDYLKSNGNVLKRNKCGTCDNCRKYDCGQCNPCINMVKFGGDIANGIICAKKKCSRIEQDEWKPSLGKSEVKKYNVEWLTPPKIHGKGSKRYYDGVSVRGENYYVGDFVLVKPIVPTKPLHVFKIVYMYECEDSVSGRTSKVFHGIYFYRSEETILGETGDPRELFLSSDCELSVDLSMVRGKASVTYKPAPENWAQLGNAPLEDDKNKENDDGKTFFYKMKYEMVVCRFERISEYPESTHSNPYEACGNCETKFRIQQKNEVHPKGVLLEDKKIVYWESVISKGEKYSIGDCIYINSNPTDDVPKIPQRKITPIKRKNHYDELYPELHRKKYDTEPKTANKPFGIGIIKIICTSGREWNGETGEGIILKVQKFCRPQDTNLTKAEMNAQNLNLLYWTDKDPIIKFADVIGKCYVFFIDNLPEPVDEWTARGPDRFYFEIAYDLDEYCFYLVPQEAKILGLVGKNSVPTEYPAISRLLRTMDVFAGCGGLSAGLHQSGVAESKWAVEKEPKENHTPAADAFQKNNPSCLVFKEDANLFLEDILKNGKVNSKGLHYPEKGEVELLVGGPPCQGFSLLNHYSKGENSILKNTGVVTFLSICDYYRPRFFLMENVRAFAQHESSMMLKLTMHCLVKMGYQCTVAVLQAGNYGVPQTRKRLIIMAAAPGEILPNYPEPLHVFSEPQVCPIYVDEKKFHTNFKWTESAPYRPITIYDVMSDLPPILSINDNDLSERLVTEYENQPMTQFQRKARKGSEELRDHVSKEFGPVIQERINRIPLTPWADWRDLPNIEVKLPNGNIMKKIDYYKLEVSKQKQNCEENEGKKVEGKQKKVLNYAGNGGNNGDHLIPLYLVRTADVNNNHKGQYGRLQWDHNFSTIIASHVDPTSAHGRVLHPEQNRVVSLREIARAQGFPDSYIFCGKWQDKCRQIGNAVPPPLALALGREILKSVEKKEQETVSVHL